MGIPGFYAWISKNCSSCITSAHSRKNINVGHIIDNLCLDMNGIYHHACQLVYGYGNKASRDAKKGIASGSDLSGMEEKDIRLQIFRTVGKIVNDVVAFSHPGKRILMMVDGTAGSAKQSQQRQRRYRSVTDPNRKFDSNCISPGTEWMSELSSFLHFFIQRQLTNNRFWFNLDVVFSNERVPGEGEHKLIRYIREKGDPRESYVLYGLDADLIMLALSTQNILTRKTPTGHIPPFYVLREDQYRDDQKIIIDIYKFRHFLISEMFWGIDFDHMNFIDDFIYLCFLLGNDFLPHSPTIDLTEGGIELLMESYSSACATHESHLIDPKAKTVNKKVFKDIFYNVFLNERLNIEAALKRGDKFADPLLNSFVTYRNGTVTSSTESSVPESSSTESSSTESNGRIVKGEPIVDFDAYRKSYYESKFPGKTPVSVCHSFFHGMDWVYRYYTNGIPAWNWKYPYEYSPFAAEMLHAIDSYVPSEFKLERPMSLYRQLLSILPPESAELMPAALRPIMEKFPKSQNVIIDLAGKKFEWQGVVLIRDTTASTPSNIDKAFATLESSLSEKEKKRGYNQRELRYYVGSGTTPGSLCVRWDKI